MAFDGEASSQLFFLIAQNPVSDVVQLPLPDSTTDDCCCAFTMNVLADISDDDNFKNDKSSFLYRFKDVIDTVEISLQNVVDGEFSDLATISDDTYGTFYPLGFYVSEKSENYIGILINWRNVLSENGVGNYRIKVAYSSSIGGSGTILSNQYNLQAFTPNRANGTVKIEYNISNLLGDNSDDKNVLEFGDLNWYNSIRINGFFGFDSSVYQRDYIKYESGQKVFVEDSQEIEFTLKTKLLPAFIHSVMRTDIIQADVISITDYNSNNANKYIEKLVKPNSDYSPNYNQMSKLASVEVKFIQEYNNLRKIRC